MEIKIIFALAAFALGANLSGCTTTDNQAAWESQQQLRAAEHAQNQAQIQTDRMQRETDRQNGQ
jgi:hypothetical protein